MNEVLDLGSEPRSINIIFYNVETLYFIMWFTKLECPHNLGQDIRNCHNEFCLPFLRTFESSNYSFPSLHFSSDPHIVSSIKRPTLLPNSSTAWLLSISFLTFTYLKHITNIQTFLNSPREENETKFWYLPLCNIDGLKTKHCHPYFT